MNNNDFIIYTLLPAFLNTGNQYVSKRTLNNRELFTMCQHEMDMMRCMLELLYMLIMAWR